MDPIDKVKIFNSLEESNAARLQKLVNRQAIAKKQTPSSVYVGQSEDGRSLVKPVGGAIVPLRTIGNIQPSMGAIVRAAAGSADTGTNIVKQSSYRKTEKNLLKIFVRADVGGFRRYWLVGVYSSPKLIAEIDLAQEKEISAKGESTGPKPKDWIFGLKTQKKATPQQPQPFRLQTFYGDGRSYNSGFAQIYESQIYRGNGFWFGNLFLDNFSLQPVTISYDRDEATVETVALPRTWLTTTYTNPRPIIRNNSAGIYLPESQYQQYRNLDFQVDVTFPSVNSFIDYLWWFATGNNTYPPDPGESGNAGAVESHTHYIKEYTVLGGSFFEGIFTPSNGKITVAFDYDGYIVNNSQYYPGPAYAHEREVTTRRFTNHLGPSSSVFCTVDHTRTYDSDAGQPPAITSAGSEYQPIVQKTFKDGGYYVQLAQGTFNSLGSDSGNSAPVTFVVKPSSTAPEITVNSNANLIVDHSWIATGDEVKLYDASQSSSSNDWLADGSAPVKEYALSGAQYTQTQNQITAYFKSTSAGFFGVTALSNLTILGAYHWEKI